MIFRREPVLFLVAVQALLGLAVAFGASLDGEQVAAVNAVAAAVAGLFARQRVTPMAAPIRPLRR
ncbi:MAG: hypothetical protein ACRD0N_09720 [Acidimicrobiales bacterium]